MSRGRLDAIAGWSLFLVLIGLAVITWLWFLVLAIDSFKWQEGSGLPRADLGFVAQLGLGLGVFCAATVFVWAGIASLIHERRRRSFVASAALLVVAAAAAVLAMRAPTLIHPVRGVIEGGVDRSLEGAGPWVTYFSTVSGGALGCAALLLVLAPRGDEDSPQTSDVADSL